MKKIALTVIVGYVLLFGTIACFLALGSGCASTSTSTAKLTPEEGAATLRDTVSVSALLILRNNPDYLPAVQAVATAIDAFVLSANTDVITQQAIDDFVKGIALRNGVRAEDVPLFLNITRRFTRLYMDTYHVDLVHRMDPGVTLWVQAVSDGIADALSAINAAK